MELLDIAMGFDIHFQVTERPSGFIIAVHKDTAIDPNWPAEWQGKPVEYCHHTWPKWVTEPWWRVNEETLEWEDTRNG